MPSPTVVIEKCPPETGNERVHAQVAEMLSKLPGIDERLKRAKRIFIKLNLGVKDCETYKGRPIAYTDPAVFEGLARFLQNRTEAEILAGDGTDSWLPAEAARSYRHMAVIEKYGHQFVDLNEPPYTRFEVPHPFMFREYALSAMLKGVDLWFSVAKMKSHHLCGITLTLKNLFGLPSNKVYGSPRVSLHSPTRLPRILTDLGQICQPAVGLIDGIIGQNYYEWNGDPVSSGVLIAGDNLVATDAVGARFMGVDPSADFGVPPFLQAENHLKIACQENLGPLDPSEITLLGDMPEGRLPYSVAGGAEPRTFAKIQENLVNLRKDAALFFKDRDDFVQKYQDEIVLLAQGKVIYHDKVNEQMLSDISRVLVAEKLDPYEAFFKLVQAEETELFEPYLQNSMG